MQLAQRISKFFASGPQAKRTMRAYSRMMTFDFCAYRSTGKERDTESGLDYFGARYYGSNMGRWMSPDWSAKAEPVPYAKLDDPQSLNLYQFVRNNPIRIAMTIVTTVHRIVVQLRIAF